MNAPLLFMAAPFVASVLAYLFLPVRFRTVVYTSAALCLFLSLIALLIPVDQPLQVAGISIPIAHAFTFLNRSFLFDPPMRLIVFLVYLSSSGGFLLGLFLPPNRYLIPVVLCSLSLFSAMVFIQPFLYALFFCLFSVCLFALCLYIFSPSTLRASIRWIVFALIGSFLLFLSGFLLTQPVTGILTNPNLRSGISLFFIGSSMLLAVPPFHFWSLDAMESKRPFPIFVVLSLFSTFALYLSMRFLFTYSVLGDTPLVYQAIQVLGILLCIVGAVVSLFQLQYGRVCLYLSFINLGTIFLALSTHSSEGISIVYVLLVSRLFLFLLCGFTLSFLPSTEKEQVKDTPFVKAPVFSISSMLLFLAFLGFVGFPGLISFPGVWATLRILSLQSDSARIAEVILIFSIGVGTISVFQQARSLFSSNTFQSPESGTTRMVQFAIILLLLIFTIFSIFPQLYLSSIVTFTSSI
jgi:formate hydrogenlyase subunit 3/multisubunit Na+/H+ antiporter MnhD subunit